MVETAKPVEAASPETTESRRASPSMRRLRLAEALGFVALVAALVGALGPAERVRTTYSWPPPTLPEGTPKQLWYTPLLLAARVPESLDASVPCTAQRALPGASSPITVLSTTRFPNRAAGLLISADAERLTVQVGARVLDRVPVAAGPVGDGECAYRLRLANHRWAIQGGPSQVDLGGQLRSMPIVNGMFSKLDLRSERSLSVAITTQVHATRVTLRQTIAWTVAALAVATALLLIAIEKSPRRFWAMPRRLTRRTVANARAADGIVALVLGGWWVLAPPHWDDGWVMARQTGFATSRGFSNYYDSLGANLPNGYWLEWTQHWLTQSSNSLLVLRLPALVCLAATWVLCRWILSRVLAYSVGTGRLPLWALTSAFIAGVLAWGMTLRPEPVTALLVTGVMGCTIRFLERRTITPLAMVAILLPLAVAGHHVGIVAVAPLIVAAPELLGWARARAAAAATLVTTTFALGVVLAFVGSDVMRRGADAQLIGRYAVSDSWYDEFRRYAYLSGLEGSVALAPTPIRRASFALIALVVVSFLLRRRRERTGLLDFPGAALAVMLVLLIAVPSKWPWHFGALLGIAAVAAASETARWRRESTLTQGGDARPALAVAVAVLAVAWSWSLRDNWTSLDLRTLEWRLGFEEHLSLSVLAAALPLVLLVGVALAAAVAGKRHPARRAAWRVSAMTAPLLVVPLVAFTAGVLIADSAKTDSWTVVRQNIDALQGVSTCGFADDVVVPIRGSMIPLRQGGSIESRPTPSWMPAPPVADIPRFALGPVGEGSASSPWFRLPQSREMGFFIAGSVSATDALVLEWARPNRRGTEFLGADRVTVDLRPTISRATSWRFVASSELPRAEREASLVRVTLQSDVAPGTAIAVSAPVTYESDQFSRILERAESSVLVNPGLLAYFPCARQPAIRAGVVGSPRFIVAPSGPLIWPVVYTSSPFLGLADIYPAERLTVADSQGAPPDVAFFETRRTIPGAILAPAVGTSFTR